MRKNYKPLSLERLKEVLSYDSKLGVFTWNLKMGSNAKIGGIAGWLDRYGYTVIVVDQKNYQAHRLAWFFTHGLWPPHEIDHKNGHPSDNRLCNLRLAQKWQQRANQKRRSDNQSGFKGVRANKGKWCARLRKKGHTLCQYGFNTPEEAHLAYLKMAKAHFGEFARGS